MVVPRLPTTIINTALLNIIEDRKGVMCRTKRNLMFYTPYGTRLLKMYMQTKPRNTDEMRQYGVEWILFGLHCLVIQNFMDAMILRSNFMDKIIQIDYAANLVKLKNTSLLRAMDIYKKGELMPRTLQPAAILEQERT